ncbi:hypothetical protein DFH27DRAFT_293808 [Peziza echinospora]|nr:hypothetical protein DFH27DRAFT_293808 [Peziza echinospora]
MRMEEELILSCMSSPASVIAHCQVTTLLFVNSWRCLSHMVLQVQEYSSRSRRWMEVGSYSSWIFFSHQWMDRLRRRSWALVEMRMEDGGGTFLGHPPFFFLFLSFFLSPILFSPLPFSRIGLDVRWLASPVPDDLRLPLGVGWAMGVWV